MLRTVRAAPRRRAIIDSVMRAGRGAQAGFPGARLRVGLLCGDLEPALDGVADYSRRLALALAGAGLDPMLLTTHRLARAPGTAGITTGWDLGGVRAAARAIRAMNLDILHVQFAPSVFGFSRAVGLLPLLLPGHLPVVATLHEYGIWSCRGPFGRVGAVVWPAAERAALLDRETLLLTPRRVRVVVTNDRHLDTAAARFPSGGAGGRPPAQVPIGSNIDVAPAGRELARSWLRRQLGAGDEAPVVVFFGFLHPVKELDRLVRAVAALRPRHPGLRLVIVGGAGSHSVPPAQATRLRRQLEDEARHYGLAGGGVLLTGYRPAAEVSRILSGADAAAFPFRDGLTAAKSGSLLAALDHGLPVIATSPPGGGPVPREGKGVLWVVPRDTAALAAALDQVLTDPGLRARLTVSGSALAQAHRWPAIARAHLDIYAETVAAWPARPPTRGEVAGASS